MLRAGGLVAFPTETVYGLGADATNARAVAQIYAAKGRPAHNPLIVHVHDLDAALRLADLSAQAIALAQAFWPGPLTLVARLRADAGLARAVTAGGDLVALRVPAHPVALRLLAAAGVPIAAPSANPSGKLSPTRADHVLAGLSGRIQAVLDGGPCAVGVESTILAPDGDGLRVLRQGGLAVEDIEAVLGASVAAPWPQQATADGTANGAADGASDGAPETARPVAPGQLASHYAPEAALRLNATTPTPDEVWVGFGPDCGLAAFTLSASGAVAEAAAALFEVLRAADAAAGPGGRIAVAPVPEAGLGRAINDRLRRAAAPRP